MKRGSPNLFLPTATLIAWSTCSLEAGSVFSFPSYTATTVFAAPSLPADYGQDSPVFDGTHYWSIGDERCQHVRIGIERERNRGGYLYHYWHPLLYSLLKLPAAI
jgi:hypothetical protein